MTRQATGPDARVREHLDRDKLWICFRNNKKCRITTSSSFCGRPLPASTGHSRTRYDRTWHSRPTTLNLNCAMHSPSITRLHETDVSCLSCLPPPLRRIQGIPIQSISGGRPYCAIRRGQSTAKPMGGPKVTCDSDCPWMFYSGLAPTRL